MRVPADNRLETLAWAKVRALWFALSAVKVISALIGRYSTTGDRCRALLAIRVVVPTPVMVTSPVALTVATSELLEEKVVGAAGETASQGQL